MKQTAVTAVDTMDHIVVTLVPCTFMIQVAEKGKAFKKGRSSKKEGLQ